MATLKLGDLGAHPCRTASKEKRVLRAYVTLTAGGAVSTSVLDEGLTITKNGVGTYDLTYPSNIATTIHVMVYSPAGTVKGAYQTANVPPSGTATIKTWGESAGTIAVADPASGDALNILFVGQPYYS